jgi:hypothetical protein
MVLEDDLLWMRFHTLYWHIGMANLGFTEWEWLI